jgi:hypothetical protein
VDGDPRWGWKACAFEAAANALGTTVAAAVIYLVGITVLLAREARQSSERLRLLRELESERERERGGGR